MIVGLLLVAALSGQALQASTQATAAQPEQHGCSPSYPDPKSNEIIVCAVKPDGYRIDPDVLSARKAKKEAMRGRPKPPENLKDRSCTVVGPAGCIFDPPGINLLAAAATAGKIADRLSKGQEIGSIFVTDPQMSEYQYYQQAKKEREAREAAKAKAAAAKLNPATGQSAKAAAAPTP